MTEYLIFHHKNPSFTVDPPENGAVYVSTSHYDKIAIVEAADLAELFYKTNHVDHDWTRNDGVSLFSKHGEKSIRSTNVGDLVLNLKTMELLVCDAIGWTRAQWMA